jgi:XisH protein
MDPDRIPYLAIDVETAQTLFTEPLAEFLVADEEVLLLIVDIPTERVVEWRT